MAKREILAGSTDQTIDIFIQDSSSTVGAGLTGLAFNSAGLTCYYRKGATGTPTALTLATQTVGGAHSDGGFVAVDGTNCPGQYRLDLSDTIVATAGMVTLYLRGATNMVPCVVEIEVVSVNKFDSVRMGLTSLPNANAEAAGGLYTRGSGAGQINQDANGRVDARVAAYSSGQIPVRVIATGAITSAPTTTSLRDTSLTQGDTDYWKGVAVKFTSGNIVGQVRPIVAFGTASDQLTWYPPTSIAPSIGDTYEIIPWSPVEVVYWDGSLVAGADLLGRIPVDVRLWNGTAVPAEHTAGYPIVTIKDGAGTGEIDTTSGKVSIVAADITSIQSGLATAATQTTILDRIGAFTGSGVNTVLGFLRAFMRKDLAAPSDVGGAYDPATDSNEAIRDRGDLSWITATGFSTHTAADVWAVGTRRLSDGTNIVLAKGTGVTGFNDLDAAGVRTAVGLASANLDTQLSGLPAGVWAVGTRTVTGGTITAITGLTLANLENMATRFLGMIELDGAVYRYTTNSLEQAPAGGGGGGSLTSDQNTKLTEIWEMVQGGG